MVQRSAHSPTIATILAQSLHFLLKSEKKIKTN